MWMCVCLREVVFGNRELKALLTWLAGTKVRLALSLLDVSSGGDPAHNESDSSDAEEQPGSSTDLPEISVWRTL